MGRFVPLRLGLPTNPQLDARLRHLENHLVAMGDGPVNVNQVTQAAAGIGAAAMGTLAPAGVSGGASSPAILGGDVTGAPNNNLVSLLQGVTLTLTSPVTGDVLTYNGTAVVNSKTVGGALTITGTLTAQGALIHSGSTLGLLGAAAVARPASYTLTGSATRVFPADPSVAYTGVDNAQPGSVYAQVSDLNTLRAVVSSLLGVVRQIQTDLGAASGFGLLAP